MSIIFRSKNFLIESADHPLVDRDDGGHLTITPIRKLHDRQQLTVYEAIELIRLTIVAGKAMKVVMTAHGVNIGRINYQDNGNWSVFDPEGPQLHIHLFGRSTDATHQKYGQALYFPHRISHPGFYQSLRPLTSNDTTQLSITISELLNHERYLDTLWFPEEVS